MNTPKASLERRQQHFYDLLALFIFALATIVLFVTTPHDGDFWWYDAPRHALNGVFVRDLLADLPFHDPVGYAVNYYLRYPALTIAFYPPLLYLISAPFYEVFGVSQTTALIPVFLLYFALMAGTYFLARRWLNRLLAVGAALALGGAPVIALWGRQVMLDVPCQAFLVWTVWVFFRYVERGRPWLLYLMAFLLLCAIFTKLTAIFMIPVLALGLLLYRGIGVMKERHFWIAAVLFTIGIIPLGVMTLEFGQVNVVNVAGQQVLGPQEAQPARTTLESWLFYLMAMPHQLGWPTVGLAAGFLAGTAVFPRWRLPWREAVLLLAWFLIGYAFFSLIGLKDTRHDMSILWPVVLAAVLFLHRVLPSRGAAAGAVGFGVAVLAVTLIEHPVPYMAGFRQAAEIIAERAPPNSVVMYSGHRDGAFIFAMRQQEQRRDLTMLRATKLLVRVAVARQLGIEETSYSEDEIARMINDHGVHYVVAETDFWTDLTPMRRLQSVLQSAQFEPVGRIAVASNVTDDIEKIWGYEPSDARELVIYRNRAPVTEENIRLSIEFLAIGRTFEGTVAGTQSGGGPREGNR